jgi:hypothetical protein
MSDCNGFKLKTLNQDCNRLAIKSSVQTSWNPSYKGSRFARNKEYDVGFDRDELIVIAFQDGSGNAEIEIEPLGDKAGTIICQSSRDATKVLRVGGKYRYALDPGEQLIFRSKNIIYPNRPSSGNMH